ncbi:hypothetical protein [Pedobacter sp. MC2016-24]|uniref:hypothetical protein n=1 Tax=Pedobacter sp. MC2016-24 TaxID=2780090 RepID=UPI0018817CD6|nr:hypothetical protein [Pedobacter sp. MC2016-24]MBE9600774.1 hypothetical protein [Pedobacter sp. MC2016-24]
MTILEGQVYWGYDNELDQKMGWLKNIMGLFSFAAPMHQHSGMAILTKNELLFLGEEELTIPLPSIEEVYLGFDEIFPASTVKNFGLFWQPIRVKFNGNKAVYMVIDYNGLKTNNQMWFDTLKNILV